MAQEPSRLDRDTFDAMAARNRAERQLTDEVLATRAVRLAWVANAIIEASSPCSPRRIRRQWNGSVGLDATPVPAFAQADRRARGQGTASTTRLITTSADPDAGLVSAQQRRRRRPEVETAGGKRFAGSRILGL